MRILALVCSVWLLSCSSGLNIERYHPTRTSSRCNAVAVFSPEYHYKGETPRRAFLYEMKLLDEIRLHSSVPLFDSSEVRTFTRGLPTDPLRETNLLDLLQRHGLDGEGVLLLRPTLLESWQEGASEVEHSGSGRRAVASFQSTVQFQSDVSILDTGKPILTATMERRLTRPPQQVLGDTRPDLMEILSLCYHRLVAALTNDYVLSARGPLSGWSLLDTPAGALGISGTDPDGYGDGPEAVEVSRDEALMQILTFRYGDVDPQWRRALLAAPPGVLVLQSPACSRLLPGDVITHVNELPVRGAHQVERWILHPGVSGGPVLTVLRDGGSWDVNCTCK